MAGNKPRAPSRIYPAALIALFNHGRFAALEPQARKLVRQDPASGFGWKVLGVSLLMQRKDALDALKRATELLPQDAEVHCNLGNAYVESRRFDEAVHSCRRALELNPLLAQAHNNLGLGLRGLGQWEAAVASFGRAIDLESRLAAAHNNYGTALVRLERRAEAIASFRRALDLNPDFAEAHHNLGNSLRDIGERDAAVASYGRALALNPSMAEAHSGRGEVLQELGRFEEAVASFRRAVEINPQAAAHRRLGIALLLLETPAQALESFRCALEVQPDARSHIDFGNALFQLDRLKDAEASYREALLQDPHSAEAHANLGSVLRRQHRAAAAQISCRNALKSDPQSAAAHALWAELCADDGRFKEAEESYRRAAALEPDLPAPYSGIVGVRRMTAEDDPWLSEALRIAALPLPPRHQADLNFALGKYFDDRQDPAQAFAHYQRANQIARSYRPRYDRQATTCQVDELIRAFDRTWAHRVRSQPADPSRPVLIVGMPRSGTLLAEQILASHPSIVGAGELAFWSNTLASSDPPLLTNGTSNRLIDQWAQAYLQLLQEVSADALRVIDKMPGNFLHLGLIHAALPNARIIHMCRNPVDTCLSIHFQNFSTAPSFACDLEDLAHFYLQYRRLMQHWHATLPTRTLLQVPFEELVADQELWSRRMLEFIEVPWDARCLDFDQTLRPVLTASRWQVRQKMSSAATQRWRAYYEFAPALLRLLSTGSSEGSIQ